VRDRWKVGPGGYWSWACVVILFSGAATLLDLHASWALPTGYALGSLYPALLLAGALCYASRRVPILPLAGAALAFGALRGVAQLAGHPGIAHGAALLVEPLLIAAAAVLVFRAGPRAAPPPANALLVVGFAAVALLEAANAVAMLGGEPLPPSLTLAWVGAAPLLLAVQLLAAAMLGRRELERALELV